MAVRSFIGDHRFLSNFWACHVIGPGGWMYPAVEHAYTAWKTNDQVHWPVIASIPAWKANEAKQYGRKLTLRKDWEEIKLTVMENLLRQKFVSGSDLARMLRAVDGEIVEGNTWKDTFWGVDLRTGLGQNHLGKLLMKLRDELNLSPW